MSDFCPSGYSASTYMGGSSGKYQMRHFHLNKIFYFIVTCRKQTPASTRFFTFLTFKYDYTLGRSEFCAGDIIQENNEGSTTRPKNGTPPELQITISSVFSVNKSGKNRAVYFPAQLISHAISKICLTSKWVMTIQRVPQNQTLS